MRVPVLASSGTHRKAVPFRVLGAKEALRVRPRCALRAYVPLTTVLKLALASLSLSTFPYCQVFSRRGLHFLRKGASKHKIGAGEMAGWSGAPSVPAEGLRSIPSPMAHSHLPLRLQRT